ncbi:MAG: hypothetical protein DRI57_09265 [Deltaproteobacteria bacterium]|nr:MAG: hypothetical protein DRI57_09265 [Deltaproteobacteria bacterium]
MAVSDTRKSCISREKRGLSRYRDIRFRDKYLAIYFQVSAYGEPQMNADKRRCLSATDSSAFIRGL